MSILENIRVSAIDWPSVQPINSPASELFLRAVYSERGASNFLPQQVGKNPVHSMCIDSVISLNYTEACILALQFNGTADELQLLLLSFQLSETVPVRWIVTMAVRYRE